MKHFVLALVALAALTVTAVADDNVRAAQVKLKDDGFYFGKIDGSPSSDFSAAVTRFQIRNGLQITGSLNAETSKALGVRPEATSDSAVSSDTWRRLRKTDRQFLEQAPAKPRSRTKTTAAAKAEDRDTSPTNVMEPAGPDSSKMVLSPERLNDYVAAFVLAGLDPQVGAELEFFADQVRYYNDGIVGRDKIRADLRRYDAQWPQRRFWLAGEVNVTPQRDSRLRVTFPLRYELRNGGKRASGLIRKTLLLEVRGEDLQIVGVNEAKA